MTPPDTIFRNRLLLSLARADMSHLGPLLEPMDLPRDMVLGQPNEPIAFAYFVESGIASVVAGNGRSIELGMIGNEGMSGQTLVMGDDRSVDRTFMQAAGTGFRVGAGEVARWLVASPTLRMSLLRYVQAFSVQVAQTAAANGHSTVEVRLARWLLMAHDRMHRASFPFTHEFLSMMLGVRRAGVTEALHVLEGHRLIKATRGEITIVDRAGLEAHAGTIYGVPEAEYERLIGGGEAYLSAA